METLRNLQLERENVGIELYGVQQQLARQQMLVEAEQDKHTVTSQLRAQKDTTLSQIRDVYRNLTQQLKNEREQSKFSGLSLATEAAYSDTQSSVLGTLNY